MTTGLNPALLGGAFNPASLSGLQLWLDASKQSTLQTDGACQFTLGQNEWLSVADNVGLQFGNQDWTVAGWYEFDSAPSNRVLFAKDNGASHREVLLLGAGTAFLLRIYDGTSNQLCSLQANNTQTTGTFFFVCCQYQASTNTAFLSVNNGTVASAVLTGTPGVATGSPFTLGYSLASNNYHDGKEDSVGKWNRLLSAAEITTLYNGGAGQVYANLTASMKTSMVSWWNLSEEFGIRHDSFGTNNLTETFNPIISPTVLNGGFETAGAPVFANWTDTIAGTTVIVRDTTNQHSGTACCRFDVDASADVATIAQNGLLVVNKTYSYSLWAKTSGIGGIKLDPFNSLALALTTSYVNYTGSATATSANFSISRNGSASQSLYTDDVTLTAAQILGAAGITAGNPTVSGDSIGQWTDQTTNAYVLAQTTGSARGTLQLGVQNGLPGILFDGVNDDVNNTANVSIAQTAAKTLTMVLKPILAAPLSTKPIFNVNSANWYLGQGSNGNIIVSWNNSSNAQKTLGSGSVLVGTTTAHIITARWTIDGSGNPTVEGWIDSTQVMSQSYADGTSATYGTKLAIGGYEVGSTYWNGYMFETFFFNTALAESDRIKLETYLRRKWGTP